MNEATKVKVRSMQSRSGNAVPNQFIIRINDCEYFQSYSSIIAVRKGDGSITLDKDMWDFSRTTGKYRNEFLGEGVAETRRKIADGTYTLDGLN